MLKILEFLFFGHNHVWETVEKRDLVAGSNRGVRVICKCSKCGVYKKFDLI